MVGSPRAMRGARSKSSTMPKLSVVSRGGPTAQEPAPRAAKPRARCCASSSSSAKAAARMASRCSMIVVSAGASFMPATT